MSKKISRIIRKFKVKNNYNKVLKKLHNKKDKIRVIFISTENSKWNYQSLYEYFENDERFEPLVVVSLLMGAHEGIDKTRNNIAKNYDFFKNRNINVEYAYKNGKYIDLKTFNPDIVFYEQPWDLPKEHKPYHVSKFALTFYVSYGYDGIYNDMGMDYLSNFHEYLFKYFVSNKNNIEIQNKKNCIYLGYPKLDTYLEISEINTNSIWKDSSKIKIIYAPHHSFENNGLRMATFDQNGQIILDIAKRHPETTWIFKPHPRFKFALLYNNIMTEEEIDEYYKQWSKIGIIYDKGDYFDIFKSSNIMITDCYSFLAEYLPSYHPLIQLVNNDSVDITGFGKRLVEGYYQCSNWSDLENTIVKLEKKENDYKLPIREHFIPELLDFNEKSSSKIYKYIKNTIFDNNETY